MEASSGLLTVDGGRRADELTGEQEASRERTDE